MNKIELMWFGRGLVIGSTLIALLVIAIIWNW